MTTLRQSRARVAMNSVWSDLSFLAIPAYKAPAPTVRHTVSGQQSSVGLWMEAPASQAGAACVPSSQSFTAEDQLTTAHRSQQLPHFLSKPPSALRVVAEHVEARARRREKHHP